MTFCFDGGNECVTMSRDDVSRDDVCVTRVCDGDDVAVTMRVTMR